MGQPVVHFEIGCANSKSTQEFYAKLFEWKINVLGPAAMIAAESGGITGHITSRGHEPHHYTIFYVHVDDVSSYLEKDTDPSGGNAHRNVCLDAGSRRKHGRFVEAEGLIGKPQPSIHDA